VALIFIFPQGEEGPKKYAEKYKGVGEMALYGDRNCVEKKNYIYTRLKLQNPFW